MSERPDYADFDSPQKFQAIESIIARRLTEYPKAICSYSGGSDSDVMIDLIERVRKTFNLPPVKYVFFNTGLEMEATKRHVKETAEKYSVEIETIRPKTGIVNAVRKYGVPFMSKLISQRFNQQQRHNVPFEIGEEFDAAEDKVAKRKEFDERYPHSKDAINWICSCKSDATPFTRTELSINGKPYLREFCIENPPDFRISARCCGVCKKRAAYDAEKGYDMVITGERAVEGGVRMMNPNARGCFGSAHGAKRLRPLYYVSDKDKAWYKEYYHLRYSDAYEVYGMKRTGCCGCPISWRAVDDLERMRPYEQNLVKAAWNVFGDSYRYRAEYNEYKARRRAEEKRKKAGQISIFDEGAVEHGATGDVRQGGAVCASEKTPDGIRA